jgi:hypothetical protein
MVIRKLKGFIFTCSNRTQKECFERKLFGMHERHKDRVLQVKEGDHLFLLNTTQDELRGIYQAACDGAKDIEPEAWNGQFPWQVRFRILEEHKPLLNARNRLREEGIHAWTDALNNEQVERIVELFEMPRIEGALDFNKKYPVGAIKTEDGHHVRSRAEALIDNWLYSKKIAHAYEQRLPVESEVYCDFYLPDQQAYIEYWGLEGDPEYERKKEHKLGIYREQGLALIELNENDISNLGDALRRKLSRFR